jgi:hypothetical protein
MLLDTLNDQQLYFKSTLLAVLQEAKADLKSRHPKLKKEIPISYKSILRREKKKISVYTDAHRDPTNGWRMYSGKQIRDIVAYETAEAEKELEK